jgi:exopolysaccharide production protein ExoZ
LANPRPSGALFFWRRFRRVAPLFYLISVPFVVAAVVTRQFNGPQTIATFLFWPAAGRTMVTPYLQAGWTLCFEMAFYSAVALVLIGGRWRRNLVLLALALAALRLIAPQSLAARHLIHPIFVEFAFGAALALLWPKLRAADPRLGWMLAGLGIAAFAAEAILGPGKAIYVRPAVANTEGFARVAEFGLPAALVVGGVAILDRFARGAAARCLAWLGDASYSTYLTQSFAMPIMAAAWTATLGRGRPLVLFAVLCAGATLVGAATYVLIERPILRDLRRLKLPAAWRQPRSTPLRT